MKKLIIVILLNSILGTICSQNFSIQETFFRDFHQEKKVSENKAQFKLTKSMIHDTLTTTFIQLDDDKIIFEKKYIKGKPVGQWIITIGEDLESLKYEYGFKNYDNIPSCMYSFKEDEVIEGSEFNVATTLDGKRLMKELIKITNYPHEAIENDQNGAVRAQFVIDVNGKIHSLRIESNDLEYLDSEVVRVVNLLPDLIPAYKNGEPIESIAVMPFHFLSR